MIARHRKTLVTRRRRSDVGPMSGRHRHLGTKRSSESARRRPDPQSTSARRQADEGPISTDVELSQVDVSSARRPDPQPTSARREANPEADVSPTSSRRRDDDQPTTTLSPTDVGPCQADVGPTILSGGCRATSGVCRHHVGPPRSVSEILSGGCRRQADIALV